MSEVLPAWKRSPYGNRRYWTRERIIEGLRDFIEKHPGPLPRSDDTYYAAKKGHAEWPPATRVYEEFQSFARAFLAAGAERERLSFHNVDWTDDEDDFLLENADRLPLKAIARRLGRTDASVRRRLYERGQRARDAQGFMSAQQVAREYNAPLSRVIRFIEAGVLPAKKRLGRWRVAPEDAEKLSDRLRAPKHSYKSSPPDVGDYERRYGLRRRARHDGTVERYEVAS